MSGLSERARSSGSGCFATKPRPSKPPGCRNSGFGIPRGREAALCMESSTVRARDTAWAMSQGATGDHPSRHASRCRSVTGLKHPERSLRADNWHRTSLHRRTWPGATITRRPKIGSHHHHQDWTKASAQPGDGGRIRGALRRARRNRTISRHTATRHSTGYLQGRGRPLVGTEGSDVLSGTPAQRRDRRRLGGNDKVSGLGGNDVICGGAGNDTPQGRQGQATGSTARRAMTRSKGGGGNDLCKGGKGMDTLSSC